MIRQVEYIETQTDSTEKSSELGGIQKKPSKFSEKTRLKKVQFDKQYLIQDDAKWSTNSNVSFWRYVAVFVSWFSILVTLVIGILEFVVAKREGSSAAFGLAFEAFLDVFTSAVVLWRYYRANDTFSQIRESLSCVVLGVLFLVSAMGIAVKAIINLIDMETLSMSENGIKFLLTTTSIAAGLCFLLFIVKAFLARKLASWTLLSDALISLMGGIIAFSMIITTTLFKSHAYLWYLDATIGLCVSLILFLYGVWLLTKHVPRIQDRNQYNQTN